MSRTKSAARFVSEGFEALGRLRGGSDPGRWRVVTVNLPPDLVLVQGTPLGELGESVEITTRKAPGERGTELYARLLGREPTGLGSITARITGRDPRMAVRSALRQTKQLLETGEILEANDNNTTRSTLLGAPIDLATSRAGQEGRL